MSGADAANHYAARLVEYMVLNAHRMDYNKIVSGLRAIALAWGHGTKGYDEAVMTLNIIKEEAWNYTLTPIRAWLLVKSVFPSGKHITHEMVAFMDNLETNGVIHYHIFITEAEKAKDLIKGISLMNHTKVYKLYT